MPVPLLHAAENMGKFICEKDTLWLCWVTVGWRKQTSNCQWLIVTEVFPFRMTFGARPCRWLPSLQ